MGVDFNELGHFVCCQNRCILKLEMGEIQRLKEKVMAMKQKEYQEWIVSQYRNATLNGIQTFKLTDTKTACLNAWRQLFNVTTYLYEKLITQNANLSSDDWSYVHGNPGAQRPTDATIHSKSWLTDFIVKHCDKSPTSNHCYMPPLSQEKKSV